MNHFGVRIPLSLPDGKEKSLPNENVIEFQVINDGLNKVFVLATGIPQEVEGKETEVAGDDYLFAVK